MKPELKRMLLKAAVSELVAAQKQLYHTGYVKSSADTRWATNQEFEGFISPEDGEAITYEADVAKRVTSSYAEDIKNCEAKVEKAIQALQDAIDQCVEP
jgi:hypothetical protein